MGYELEPGNPHLQWYYESKQNKYHAANVEELDAGYLHLVKWGRHTHWSWRQEPRTDMSPGCLEEVRKKQRELFKDRKLRSD